ncbi:MAG: TRAP transporter substrate-binding protein [Lautropia sp.]
MRISTVRSLCSLVAGAFLGAALLLPGPTQAADYPSMNIRFGDVINRNFGYYQGMLAFKAEVEKRSGGKIKVELISDGKLGSPKDALEAVQLGAVQLAVNAGSYTQSIVLEHGIWDMPFLFKDRAAWRTLAYGPLGKEIGQKIEARGLKFLTWNSAGGRGILSKKPVATPADFAGMKIREQPDPVLVDIMKAWGGQPVVMNLGDVYTSLQQGILDGADVSIELVTAFKFFETAKYYTEIQHIITPGIVVANMAWWKSLDKATQALFEEVITKHYRETTDAWFVENDPAAPLEAQQKAMKLLTDKGVTIVKADLAALKKASLPVFQAQREKIGKDLVDRVSKAVGYSPASN